MNYLELIKAAADISIAVCAAVALIIAVRQIRISREVGSLAAYESYHQACLQYPEFAPGFPDWRTCESTKRECYCTFVLFALMTGERVLKLFPKDKTWIFAVKDDIRLHRDFIASEDFREFRAHQAPIIRKLIDEVLDEPLTAGAGEVTQEAELQISAVGDGITICPTNENVPPVNLS